MVQEEDRYFGLCFGVRAVKCCSEARPTRVPRSPICVCNFRILAMCVVVSGAAGGKCGAGGPVFRVVLLVVRAVKCSSEA